MLPCKFNDQSQDGNTKSSERTLKLTSIEQIKDVIDLCEAIWPNNLVNKQKKDINFSASISQEKFSLFMYKIYARLEKMRKNN